MVKYKGKGVYGAVAAGTVSVYKRQKHSVCRTHVDDVQKEFERFEAAKMKAAKQLSELYNKALQETGEASAQIFEVYRMILEDGNYNMSVANIIKTLSVNAEYAVLETADRFAAMFAAMQDSYMQARGADMRDISNRLIACMPGSENGTEYSKCAFERPEAQETGQTYSHTEAGEEDDPGMHSASGQASEQGMEAAGLVICADDLAPAETVSLDRDKVAAFVTAFGSDSSHTAILARSMNIPAVIGAGEDFLKGIKDGDRIIVDGYTGEIFVNPDVETDTRMKKKQEDDLQRKALLREFIGKENVTLDGIKVDIFANIGSVDEVGSVLVNDAGGIGLLRSEFLYLERNDYPSEEQQFCVYRRVLEKMAGKKVIIRTLDIGADKQIDYFHTDKEVNPALGLRGIRLCLTRPEIFRIQLRAMYRASVYGNLGIMFPMITSVSEVEKILAVCDEVREELKKEKIPYSENVELGIMIETPAAAVISDLLAPMVDFFSVGTNDLTQYTLACDRQNAKLEPFCDTHHEAVLRLIELSARNAHANGAWIGICGELAADTSLTETFLRMGVDEFSVPASLVLPLREAVRKTDLRLKQ